MGRKQSTAEKFWSRIEVRGEDDCWLWRGGQDGDGYGRVKFQNGQYRAHQLADILTNGPMPEGLCSLHHCDNRPCCNPRHLFRGTKADNMRDRDRKGRQARQPGEFNGRAQLTWGDVDRIRNLHRSGWSIRGIHSLYPQVVVNSIRNVVHYRTWIPRNF